MEQSLYHYGILGMRWGIRRYQNEDGTLTEAGRKRYTTLIEAKDKAVKQQKYYAKKVNQYKDSSAEKTSNRYHLSSLYKEQTEYVIKNLDELLSYNISDIKNMDIKRAEKFVKHVFSEIEDIDINDYSSINEDLKVISDSAYNWTKYFVNK